MGLSESQTKVEIEVSLTKHLLFLSSLHGIKKVKEPGESNTTVSLCINFL